jgi:AcrR family transcriptional regulator
MAITPMGGGRRLTRDEARQQTRERLLDAAADVFKRFGYNGASLEAVAEAAGYTKGAVYSNFDTKADLFMALLDRYVEGEIAAQVEQFSGKTLDQVIDELDTIIERQITGDPLWAVLRMEFWLVASRDPEVRKRLVGKAEPYRQLAGEMIDDMLAREGRTAPFTGRELGILLNALATGLAIQTQHEPDAVDWTLLGRAARQLAGLDGSAVKAVTSEADAPDVADASKRSQDLSAR